MNYETIKGIFSYTLKILKHKFYVLKAGIAISKNVSFKAKKRFYYRLLIHDMSKFSKKEFMPYIKKFELNIDDGSFKEAWNHHYRVNDHHIKYWPEGHMPELAIMEMIADWISASTVYGGVCPTLESWEWGKKNLVKRLLMLQKYDGCFMIQQYYCPRSYAINILKKINLISEEQIKELEFYNTESPC